MNYKYHLLKYKGTQSRFTCPNCGRKRCFTPYVDDNENIIGEEYGRCDHESSCGYVKYPPSGQSCQYSDYSYRKSAKQLQVTAKPQLEGICTLPENIVRKTLCPDYPCDFITFLRSLFSEEDIRKVANEYQLGVTKDHSVIFYQIDSERRFRTGKVMKYNPNTGYRIKDPSAQTPITWAHSLLKQKGLIPKDWELTQCLFGEHLLKRYPDKPVGLVEAEKTAIICSILIPDCVWVAVGGKSNLGDKVDILSRRKVVAFPDIDGYDAWVAKCAERPYLGIIVSDYLQLNATEEDKVNGADIADLLIRYARESIGGEDIPLEPMPPDTNPLYAEIFRYISPEYHSEVQALSANCLQRHLPKCIGFFFKISCTSTLLMPPKIVLSLLMFPFCNYFICKY